MLILTNETDFDAVFDIMQEAFPPNERRTKEEQRALLSEEKYRLFVAKEGDAVQGFLAVWALSIPFIEHFAVSNKLRNAGLGGKLLDEAVTLLGGACLEAEPPETELARRRIGFYNRHGFVLNEYTYTQPSITKGQPPVPLMIMSHGKGLSTAEFKALEAEIMKTVYKTND